MAVKSGYFKNESGEGNCIFMKSSNEFKELFLYIWKKENNTHLRKTPTDDDNIYGYSFKEDIDVTKIMKSTSEHISDYCYSKLSEEKGALEERIKTVLNSVATLVSDIYSIPEDKITNIQGPISKEADEFSIQWQQKYTAKEQEIKSRYKTEKEGLGIDSWKSIFDTILSEFTEKANKRIESRKKALKKLNENYQNEITQMENEKEEEAKQWFTKQFSKYQTISENQTADIEIQKIKLYVGSEEPKFNEAEKWYKQSENILDKIDKENITDKEELHSQLTEARQNVIKTYSNESYIISSAKESFIMNLNNTENVTQIEEITYDDIRTKIKNIETRRLNLMQDIETRLKI